MKKITKILLAALPITAAVVTIPSVTVAALRNNSQSSSVDDSSKDTNDSTIQVSWKDQSATDITFGPENGKINGSLTITNQKATLDLKNSVDKNSLTNAINDSSFGTEIVKHINKDDSLTYKSSSFDDNKINVTLSDDETLSIDVTNIKADSASDDNNKDQTTDKDNNSSSDSTNKDETDKDNNSSSDSTNKDETGNNENSSSTTTNTSFSWKLDNFDKSVLSKEILKGTPIIDLSKTKDQETNFGKETGLSYSNTIDEVANANSLFKYLANRVNIPTGYSLVWNISWINKNIIAITDENNVRTTNVLLMSLKCIKNGNPKDAKWVNIYITNFTNYVKPSANSMISGGINLENNDLAKIGLPKNSSIYDLKNQISMGSTFINYLDSNVTKSGYNLKSVSYDENGDKLNVSLTYKSYKGNEEIVVVSVTGYTNPSDTKPQMIWLKGLFPIEATSFEVINNDPIIDLSKLDGKLGTTELTKNSTYNEIVNRLKYQYDIPLYFKSMVKGINATGYNFTRTPYSFPSGVTNVEGQRFTKVIKFSIQYTKGSSSLWKTVFLVNYK